MLFLWWLILSCRLFFLLQWVVERAWTRHDLWTALFRADTVANVSCWGPTAHELNECRGERQPHWLCLSSSCSCLHLSSLSLHFIHLCGLVRERFFFFCCCLLFLPSLSPSLLSGKYAISEFVGLLVPYKFLFKIWTHMPFNVTWGFL